MKNKLIFLILLIIISSFKVLVADDTDKHQVCKIQAQENLTDFINNHWKLSSTYLPKIKEISKLFDLPEELIISAFLIEDIRFYQPIFKKNMFNHTYLKAQIRLLIPNLILDFFGHSPNLKNSNLGLVNIKSIKKSIQYILKTIKTDVSYFNTLDQINRSKISLSPELAVAIHLKAIEIYWMQHGISLKSFDFGSVSWGFRLGVWISLYSILKYDGIKTHYFINKAGEIKIPHPNPKLGGTILWNCISYGEIVKSFIDLHLYHQSKLFVSP
jgi:hypothetical protein